MTNNQSKAKPANKPQKKMKVSEAVEAVEKGDTDRVREYVKAEIEEILNKYELGDYESFFLMDEVDSISRYHSNKIYSKASDLKKDPKDIMLFISTSGGSIEPAYLISKTLKRLSKDKFTIAVPRRAKSAGTLIALGADEIHMGMMSELGPIDPQVGGLPALALGNALNLIAELACKYPESTPMLNKYIDDNIPVRILGYYQRVNDSAVQYAERLLQNKKIFKQKTPREIAEHLVNHYKDHSFVIDIEEAESILGSMIKTDTKEYEAADEISRFLGFIKMVCDGSNKIFWVVGGTDGFGWRDSQNNSDGD